MQANQSNFRYAIYPIKSTLIFPQIFIEHNPFSAQIKINLLEEELKKEKAALETLNLKLNPGPNMELEKAWDAIKDELKKLVQDKIDQLTQDDPPLSQGTVNDAYANIRRLLHGGKYFEAFMVIRHAERMYPEAKLLRTEMDKKDQVMYFYF